MKRNFKIRIMALLLCVMLIMSVSCADNKPETNTPTTTNAETEAPSTSETEAASDSEAEAPSTSETEAASDSETEAASDSETEAAYDSETEAVSDSETEAPSNPDEDEPLDTDSVEDTDTPANDTKKIVTGTKKLYGTIDTFDTLDIAYYEDTPEILLVSTDVLANYFFKGLLSPFAAFEFEETEDSFIVTRSNGAYCMIDFVNESVFFNDLDLFRAKRSDSMSDFLATSYLDSNGNNIYFNTTNNKDIAGRSYYLELKGKGIPIAIYEGEKYLPLQTFNDIFLVTYNLGCVYNGQDLYLAQQGIVDASLVEQYYSVGPAERSEALAEFTFNEFCVAMDLNYGLKDEHGVDVGFSLYLYYAGLYDDLISTDATTSSLGLVSLAFGYLADKHTGLNMPSPYTGSPQIDKSKAEYDPNLVNYINLSNQILATRAAVMPDGTLAYQEIGNTAYVTFDSFTIDPIRWQDYSEASLMAPDTFGLIIYAHSMITRENSPIENVVLDLSCNGGGAIDAAVYVVAWMLGQCNLSMTNPITNSFSTTSYTVDVNLDGVFDSRDTISDKNLYCITSPISFSCGNLVPALLKESGRVTMLGGTSGGGACAVNFLTLADGSSFQFSSPKHLTVVANGSYYTIDRGVDPHYYFTKYESYFERDSLTEFINGLR